MAIWIVKNSGKISYGIKRYLCDTLEDLPYSENGEVVIPGSKAYVISEKKTYMMGSDEEWHEINEGSGSGASSMSQLTDVDLTNLEDGQVLKYDEDTQTWKPGDDASATSLGNLDDVDLTNLQDGQVIIYDSTTEKWLASDIPSDIAEVTQAQYDALPSETKSLPIIYQISDKGYFFYKGKKFRASKELTQAEYDQLTQEEKNNGTIYKITDKAKIYCLDEEYHAVKEITSADYALLTSDEKNNGTLYVITDEETTAADIPYSSGVSVEDKIDDINANIALETLTSKITAVQGVTLEIISLHKQGNIAIISFVLRIPNISGTILTFTDVFPSATTFNTVKDNDNVVPYLKIERTSTGGKLVTDVTKTTNGLVIGEIVFIVD